MTSVHCRLNPATFLLCLFRTALHTLAYVSFSFLFLLSRTNGFYDSARAKWEILDVSDYNISEMITTTKTSFKITGSVNLPVPHSGNGTQISLTVSEIFDRKHIALTRCFFIFLPYYSFSSFRRTGQHSVYFDHVTPPTGESQSWIF